MGAVDREALTAVDAEKARQNGRDKAYACIGSHDQRMGHFQAGMTKREAMATAAMQGLVSGLTTQFTADDVASLAVNVTDALLERLAYKE